MLFWLQIRWLTVKLALVTAKHGIKKAASLGKTHLLMKTIRAAKRAKAAKKKVGRAAKDVIIPSLPGVSKVKLPNPPVPRLLRSNIPPTDSEEILIRDAIEKAEAEASHLEEIFTARTTSGQSSRAWQTVTKHKIGQANRFLRQQKALVSPIRRLPPEILQEIFLWVAPSIQQIHSRWRWNADLPWGLGQVCRSWRASALAISALWSHMPTIQLKKSNAKTKLQLQYLGELLRRSREAPLDMYIYSRAFDRDKHPVIDLLCQHAERWQVVTFELAPRTLAGFHSIKGRISSLKSLTLQTRLARETDHPVDLFEAAPCLETVSVSGPSFNDIVLPFAQLVHYKERLLWGNRINKVITSPLLESLTVLELADEAFFPVVTIPRLTKLQIKFQYRPQRNCFDNLTLPAVEDIRIVSYRGNLMGSLIRMISKSNTPCPLKTLCVRSEFLGPNELTRLLALTPELVSLDITIPSYPKDIINLASGFQNRPLAPLLETCNLYLEDTVTPEISEALNTLGRSRCELGNDLANTDLLLPGELRSLKNLIVYFDGSEWTHSQQAFLEHWQPNPLSEELDGLREQLHGKFPDLGFGRPNRPKKFDLMWSDKVSRILTNIDQIEVDNALDIYQSRVHLSLKSLADTKITSLASFSNRSKKILAKWQPLFEASLQDRHWAFKGPYSMAYIADNHALRTSPEDAMTIVFGLKEPIPFSSAFWPMFMAR